jgi:hypothetical protein
MTVKTTSDVISSADGSVVLRTGGDLVLVDGSAPTNSSAVAANGSGNILLETLGAGSSISLIVDVVSDTGSISVIAANNLSTIGTASLRTGGTGTLDIEARSGSVTLSTESDQETEQGDIRVSAGENITIGGIMRTLVGVSLIAERGWIRDGDSDGSTDIDAATLRFAAGRWVGQLGANDNAIETTVERIGGYAGHEGVNLLESDAIEVNTVSASVERVEVAGTTRPLSDVDLSEIVTSENGTVVLRAIDGDIFLNGGESAAIRAFGPAVGEGRVLVEAMGEDRSVYINSSIISNSGAITVFADLNVEAAETASISTGLNASIGIEALNGSIRFGYDSQISSGSGDIELWAANNIELGGRVSTNGTVVVTAESGSIGDIFLDGTVVIDAGQLVAEAGIEVGNPNNTMGIDVDAVTVRSIRGGTHLSERNGLAIVDDVQWRIDRVGADGFLQARLETSTLNGIESGRAVTLEVDVGNLNLTAPITAQREVVLELGFGALIDSYGLGTDVTAASLEVIAHAIANSSNALDTQVGALSAHATRGSLYLNNLGTLSIESASATGSIDIVTSGSLTVQDVAASATVRLESTAGALFGSGSDTVDITAALADLGARNGIGGTGAADLDLAVDQLLFANSATGSAYLSLHGVTTVVSAELAGSGNVYVRANDDLRIEGIFSLYQGSLRAKVYGDLTLTGDVLASGNVNLLAQNMALESARLLSSSADLVLRAFGTLEIDALSSLEAPEGEVTTVAVNIQSAATVDAGLRIDMRAAAAIASQVSRLHAPRLRLTSLSGTLNHLQSNAEWFSFQTTDLHIDAFQVIAGK